eukprot:tig00000540_g1924.t1
MKRPADPDAAAAGIAPPRPLDVAIKTEAGVAIKIEGGARPRAPATAPDPEGDAAMEDVKPATATSAAAPSGAPLPSPAASQIVRTTVLVKSNPRKGAARDAIFAVPWQPADVERLASPGPRRAVVQISPQIVVQHASGARRTLRAFNVFDFDVPTIRFPAELEDASLGAEQVKNAKKSHLAGVLGRCENLAQYWTQVPEIRDVARLAVEFSRALAARGVPVLVVFSGLKGFHVYVRHAELVAAIEGPGAEVYSKEEADAWWAAVVGELRRLRGERAAQLRDPTVPREDKLRIRRSMWAKATRAAGPRRVLGMLKSGRWEGLDVFERVIAPFAEEHGIGPLARSLVEEGIMDLAPFRVNSGCRSDEHRHGWTSFFPVVVPPEAVDDEAIAASIGIHATQPDPALVSWNSDEWRWIGELARDAAPKYALAPEVGAPQQPPSSKRPRTRPRRPLPTLDGEAREGEEGAEEGEAGEADATEAAAYIDERVVARLGLLACGRARDEGWEAARAALRAPFLGHFVSPPGARDT